MGRDKELTKRFLLEALDEKLGIITEVCRTPLKSKVWLIMMNFEREYKGLKPKAFVMNPKLYDMIIRESSEINMELKQDFSFDSPTERRMFGIKLITRDDLGEDEVLIY